ncbi:MAG: enoyl-CoA hydratase/isomerase family protein [Novosphingobium sp.]
MENFETLSLEITDAIATLTLARPKVGNALSSQGGQELKKALSYVAANSSLRLLIIRSQGKVFCVGGDIGEFASLPDLSPAIRAMVIDFNGACATLASLDIPVMAVVQGAVAGAGLCLLALADHVIATNNATFTYAYPGVGFSADGGATWLLPKLMGLRAFQGFATGGKSWTADQALQGGLISEVVDSDALDTAAQAWAARIASGPTRAFGAIRRLALESYGLPYSAHLAREMDEISDLARSEDAGNAIQALLNNRRPVFSGR